MKTHLDADGQPVIAGYNHNRRVNRAISELIGMLRGIVADNYINEAESEALAKMDDGQYRGTRYLAR